MLRDWCRHRPDFAEIFKERLRNTPQEVREVDDARRVVSHHFQAIFNLQRARLLTEARVRDVVSKAHVEFLRWTIEPLEHAGDPEYDRASFDYFGRSWNVASKVPGLEG